MVQTEKLENSDYDPYSYKGNSTSLLAKYDIPITHLDFTYVEKCTDGRELEKIFHILQSGEEGHYPELIKAAEEKLRNVYPKSKFLRKLSKVVGKDDLDKEEWNNITKDLNEWVLNISKDNRQLEASKGTVSLKNNCGPDIRKPQQIIENLKTNTEKRLKSTDYASWDKYDPDTEILKMDLEEEKLKNQAKQIVTNAKKKKKQVKFNCFKTEVEAKTEANSERLKGNEYFKIGDYDMALAHYTASLECKVTVPCLNNRAMTYIKKEEFQEAIDDCDSAIAIEPENFKSNFRKSLALEKLNRFLESLECIETCILIDPNNIMAQELAERMRKKCGLNLGAKRFAIEDVNCKTKESHSKFEHDKYQEKQETEHPFLITKNDKVLIPIPGTSKMTEPYYIECDTNDVQRTLIEINNRMQILFITNLHEDDDECGVNHLNHICTKEHTTSGLEFNDEGRDNMPMSSENDEGPAEHILCLKSKRKSPRNKFGTTLKINVNLQNDTISDDKDAGGEPYIKQNAMTLPEDIYAPYTFLKTWTAARDDLTFKKHAHIIRHMNMDQLVEVIGCKLDNSMFSTIVRTLCEHFTVPGEVEKVHSVLLNITRLPRFQIIAMLMSEQDRNCVNMLISFLHQHDRGLPEYVIKTFK